jgi:hypothetical protein
VNTSPVRRLQLSCELLRELVVGRRGTYVTNDDYDSKLRIGNDNVDVFKPDGSWLLSHRVGMYEPARYQHLVKQVANVVFPMPTGTMAGSLLPSSWVMQSAPGLSSHRPTVTGPACPDPILYTGPHRPAFNRPGQIKVR